MKLYEVIVGIVLMLVVPASLSTTLKLSAEIDVLVLDGHNISGSLLKGADALELGQGEHQLLFRIEKKFFSPVSQVQHWVSVPQIVIFNARSQSVQITLPKLSSLSEVERFDASPEFSLTDEHGREIENRRDILELPFESDLARAMATYNLRGGAASSSRFAQTDGQRASTSSYKEEIAMDSRPPAERVLYLWYKQVDTATRQRFNTLVKALRAS